jgi:predicted amidophosphoribosyltransferase
MSARFYEEYSDINFDLICGAPPHDKKKDFDQVDILCKKLSLIIDIPYKRKVFIQTRKTLKQSTLGYKERQKNLKDSLCIKDKTITDGKTILLIDDICTTRSTLNECARALKAGGAKKIYALTVATVNNPE